MCLHCERFRGGTDTDSIKSVDPEHDNTEDAVEQTQSLSNL